jgi:acetoin utilization deacetylase AcuC-like enzyme
MAIVYRDQIFENHETGKHPENPSRLRAINTRFEASDLSDQFASGKLREATDDELLRVHAASHLAAIQKVDAAGGGRLDNDTVMSPKSHTVARTAAGCAIDAVDEVISGRHDTAVCLTRPPGHHATPTNAMGFCLYNNVAVAAAHATITHGLRRVLVVDWDVHHGNGTQDCFYGEELVYFMSSHRDPFYPGTGAKRETGTGAGLGTIFNLPTNFGISRERFVGNFRGRVEEAAEACRPELVLISAGFDAHKDDPIGSLGLESEDFEALTDIVKNIATTHCSGRIVSLLEGGYNTDALAESVEVHMRTLTEHS